MTRIPSEHRLELMLYFVAAFVAGGISGWVGATTGWPQVFAGWAVLAGLAFVVSWQTKRRHDREPTSP